LKTVKSDEGKRPAIDEEYTLFNKIIDGKTPCTKIYEDDTVIAFKDIKPTAKVHHLIIPKDRDGLSSLAKAEERHIGLLGRILLAVSKVAKQEGLDEGY